MDKVRVRFAPSPTGYLHVGGARTALFNWLFARHEGGKFILRIEDTDKKRSSAELESDMLEDIEWLGLKWDEGPGVGGEYGPYRQSERIDIYSEHVKKLVGDGTAYPCFCSEELLAGKKEQMIKDGVPPRYDGTCRNLSEEEIEGKRKEGLPESVRFIVDADKENSIDDIIRGNVVFPPGMVGDFVILRSNGLPTYNFAAAVDDALMKISHVIRGEEHLSNTLRQIMIYRALGMDIPRFAHIPLILGSDRSKLSKRHGAPNVRDYRKEGYPPDAVVNYLSMLGWSSPDQEEILTLEELVSRFTLERVSESPSIFDKTKLRWVSAQNIRAGKAARYLDKAVEYFPETFRERYTDEEIEKIFNIISENMPCFSEIEKLVLPFSPGYARFDKEIFKAYPESGKLLKNLIKGIENTGEWTGESVKDVIKSSGKLSGVKGKDLYIPIRAAVTGEVHGPDLSSILMIKGKEDVLDSLKRAYSEIQS